MQYDTKVWNFLRHKQRELFLELVSGRLTIAHSWMNNSWFSSQKNMEKIVSNTKSIDTCMLQPNIIRFWRWYDGDSDFNKKKNTLTPPQVSWLWYFISKSGHYLCKK